MHQKERRIRHLERELNAERHMREDLEAEMRLKEQLLEESGQFTFSFPASTLLHDLTR